MAQQKYVIVAPNGLYMTAYNLGSPENSSFGNLQNAVEYDTLAAANADAANIGGGTVGTVKPH